MHAAKPCPPEELVPKCRDFLSKIEDVDLVAEEGTVYVSFVVEIHLHDPPETPSRKFFRELPDGTRISSGGYDEIHVRAVATEDVVTGAELVTRYTYFAPGSNVQQTTECPETALSWLARDLQGRTSFSVFFHKTVRTCEGVPELVKARTKCPWSNTLKGDEFVH